MNQSNVEPSIQGKTYEKKQIYVQFTYHLNNYNIIMIGL